MGDQVLTSNTGFELLGLPDQIIAALTPLGLFGMVGDSQFCGTDSPNVGDNAFNLDQSDATILYNGKFAAGAGVDPPAWVDVDVDGVMTSMKSHGGLVSPEYLFGQTLRQMISGVAVANTAGNGYLLEDNWKPSSSFMLATTGKRLFDTWVDRMHAFETLLNKRYAGTFISLGGNDAASGASKYNVYEANLVATAAAIRTAFGSQTPIVLIRTHVNTAVDPTGLGVVRAAQVAVDAADSRMTLIDVDDLKLKSDVTHFTCNDSITTGQRAGDAMLTLLGYPPQVVTVPTIVGCGPADYGIADMKPRSAGCTRDGDLEVMHVQTGSTAAFAIPTPSGWTPLGSVTTTSNSSIFTTFNFYGREVPAGTIAANGGHTAPTTISIGAAGRENLAKIICIRGPNPLTLANIEAVNLWAENGFSNPKTIPAITTLTNGALVVALTGFWAGGSGRLQGVTNGAISGFTEFQDGDNIMPSTSGMMLSPS